MTLEEKWQIDDELFEEKLKEKNNSEFVNDNQ